MEQTQIAAPLLILIAGPYRSGTNDDPALIAKNVDLMNQIALKVYEMGHIPLLGEWLALPLIETAGSEKIGDEVFNRIFNPLSVQIVEFCSAVLRVGGPSVGADEMIKIGLEHRKIIFGNIDEIPLLAFK
jgi:GDP-mannose pyrophosphatase NudK